MVNIEEIKLRITRLSKEYELSMLVLFGSQAVNKTHSESDVDVAYVSEKKLSFSEEAKFNSELTEIFNNENISLVNLKKASPLLTKQIMTKGIVLFEKNKSIFNDYYIYALRIYDEAKPLFELRKNYLKNIIEQYKHA